MNFDLNINNYKKNELTEMFDLPPNYGRELVDIKETKLRESILNNKEIKEEVRMKTIYFLTEAKKILLGDVYQKVEHAKEKVQDYFNSIYDLKPVKIEDTDNILDQYKILSIEEAFNNSIKLQVENSISNGNENTISTNSNCSTFNYFTTISDFFDTFT